MDKSITIAAILAASLMGHAAFASAPAPMPPPPEEGSDVRELEDARRALAEAARRVAELSAREADRVVRSIDLERVGLSRAFVGVVVDDTKPNRDGVAIREVVADGPAAKAGIKADDVLVSIGDHSLVADRGDRAPPVMRIYKALEDAKPGDEVTVKYKRGDRAREAKVKLGETDRGPVAFSFGFGDGPRRLIEVPPMPPLHGFRFTHPHWDLELVAVSKELGEYFNTEGGLLVVRAPAENALTLKDGDVVLSIDGREPQSPTHAVRILRSYRAGETVTIEVMRKRRKQTIEVTLPEPERTSFHWAGDRG